VEQLTQILNIALLVAMMVGIGLKTEIGQVMLTLRQTSLVIRSVAANFLLVPLITAGLLYLFHAQPMASAGFMVLALCPGAPFGPVATAMAKGDVPMSVGLMVVLAGLSAVLTPVLLGVLLTPLAPDAPIKFDVLQIVKILIVAQILPLAAGLAVNYRAAKVAAKLAQPLLRLSNLLIVVVIVIIAVTQINDAGIFGLRVISGMCLLLVMSLLCGWACGGPGIASRNTLGLTTGVRNAAVALVIVNANFAGTRAVTAVAAYGLFSIVGGLLCAALLGRRQASG
jgi:BASS family bile acid:Na+ symporter